MKWQPSENSLERKRVGVLADRALSRLLFGPVELLRVLR